MNNIHYNFVPLSQSIQSNLYFKKAVNETDESILPIKKLQKYEFLQYDYTEI